MYKTYDKVNTRLTVLFTDLKNWTKKMSYITDGLFLLLLILKVNEFITLSFSRIILILLLPIDICVIATLILIIWAVIQYTKIDMHENNSNS